jgi:hypothetical protein
LTFNKLALMATTTVLIAINAAPAAGFNNIPHLYKMPAAKGNATILYPFAQMEIPLELTPLARQKSAFNIRGDKGSIAWIFQYDHVGGRVGIKF